MGRGTGWKCQWIRLPRGSRSMENAPEIRPHTCMEIDSSICQQISSSVELTQNSGRRSWSGIRFRNWNWRVRPWSDASMNWRSMESDSDSGRRSLPGDSLPTVRNLRYSATEVPGVRNQALPNSARTRVAAPGSHPQPQHSTGRASRSSWPACPCSWWERARVRWSPATRSSCWSTTRGSDSRIAMSSSGSSTLPRLGWS